MIRRAVLMLIGLLALAAPAHAATIRVDPVEIGDSRLDVDYAFVLRYTAAAHERNDLTLAYLGHGVFQFTDSGATIDPGADCTRVTSHRVTCTIAVSDPPAFRVDLGDGNDRFRAVSTNGAPVHVDGGSGNDTLIGGRADETLNGQAGNDTIRADAGSDKLFGGPGDDRLDGGSDDDTISGGAGRDVESGGPGDDTLLGTDGGVRAIADDVLDGGPGADTASYYARRRAIHASLRTQVAGATGEHDRLRSIENLTGTRAADVLDGDGGPNTLTGGGGDDRIDAGGGDDAIEADTADVHCGAGTDTSVFDSTATLLRADCEYGADARLQPASITPRQVSFRLGCPDYSSRATLRLPAHGLPWARPPYATLLARGRLASGDSQSACTLKLTLTPAGRRLLRGHRVIPVTLDLGDNGGWSFELKDKSAQPSR